MGVVLSGSLDDGAAGLMAVQSRGGTTIVQDPGDALVDGMPRNALKLVEADYIAPAREIASILATLATQPMTMRGRPGMSDPEERLEAAIAEDFREQAPDRRDDEPTISTCPDCGGVLWQGGNGGSLHFRCHVGHAYAPEVLFGLKSDELEAALWASVRLLKE